MASIDDLMSEEEKTLEDFIETEEEVAEVTEPIRDVVQEPEQIQENEEQSTDPLLMDAIQTALEAGQASTGLLQIAMKNNNQLM